MAVSNRNFFWKSLLGNIRFVKFPTEPSENPETHGRNDRGGRVVAGQYLSGSRSIKKKKIVPFCRTVRERERENVRSHTKSTYANGPSRRDRWLILLNPFTRAVRFVLIKPSWRDKLANNMNCPRDKPLSVYIFAEILFTIHLPSSARAFINDTHNCTAHIIKATRPPPPRTILIVLGVLKRQWSTFVYWRQCILQNYNNVMMLPTSRKCYFDVAFYEAIIRLCKHAWRRCAHNGVSGKKYTGHTIFRQKAGVGKNNFIKKTKVFFSNTIFLCYSDRIKDSYFAVTLPQKTCALV